MAHSSWIHPENIKALNKRGKEKELKPILNAHHTRPLTDENNYVFGPYSEVQANLNYTVRPRLKKGRGNNTLY